MEHSPRTDMNLIDRILDLPTELRAMILLPAVIPWSLHLEYSPLFDTRFDDMTDNEREQVQIRLRYFNTPISGTAQAGIFHPWYHLVNKRWWTAVEYVINTVTVWDLGEAEGLYHYLRIGRYPFHRKRQDSFFQRLKAIQNVTITIKPYLMCGSTGLYNLKLLSELPKIIEDKLALSLVRLRLKDLISLRGLEQEKWVKEMVMFAVYASGNEKFTSTRPPELRITCPATDLKTRRGKEFLEKIRRKHDATFRDWTRTGECRYQGPIGELALRWSGDRSTREQLLMDWKRSKQLNGCKICKEDVCDGDLPDCEYFVVILLLAHFC